ncbi:MAG: IS66 family insertion sequence element accessory protein TnpB [Deltaproteobacteria bacterium]|jgi:transposase|nr:IS66 family insertion sequence element accessory protein TnpB [Deltaproteobacteria bacterium]MBW2532660.1 IS66 family insertion sequence element accessory protein TnpB [Deltaproteobacteria bacterium]
MITFGPGQRYWLYRTPADMRKSFDGLCGLVTSELGRDPLSGEVFVFVNRRRTHVKLLVWDRSGFVLYYKRLEQGTFELPPMGERLTWSQLVLMLEGIAMRSVRYRKRYVLPESVAA